VNLQNEAPDSDKPGLQSTADITRPIRVYLDTNLFPTDFELKGDRL